MGTLWANDRVNGDKYVVVEREDDADTWWLSALGFCALLALGLVWWAIRHPILSTLGFVLAYLAAEHGALTAVASLAGVLLVLAVWRAVHRRSFTRVVGLRCLARWRVWWVYRRRWASTMEMSGLATGWSTRRYVPRLVRLACDRSADHLLVKLLPGQTPADFEDQAEALANTFGAHGCRVRVDRPGRVWLDLTRRDTLTRSLAALPVGVPDLTALPVGVRDDGHPWTVNLLGTHVLVAGASGSGKGSILWSLIRSVGPAVAEGWVQLWTVDPKGGMELAPGLAMFTKFAYQDTGDTIEGERMALLCEDAAALVKDRASRLRGITRQHTPSTADPLVVLVVDELAYLTAYLPDAALRKRISSALSIVLSQGRAVGVSVVAAVQDPRKEIVTLRDLFPSRVALRMTESAQADLVLGDGAHSRGAVCERIPRSRPGTGFVLEDGHREPMKVRAAYVNDDDITAMCQAFPARRALAPVEDQADTPAAASAAPLAGVA